MTTEPQLPSARMILRDYVARGLKVFPLHWITEAGRCSCADSDCRNAGKHPLTSHGVKDATIDIGIIAAWWAQWPMANIGMALDGFVVVDVDPRNGGDAALETVEAQHGPLPDTWLALTGGGGKHHVYRAREGASYPGKLAKGVDLKRGAGAYIVVEPSLHASGIAYAWEASSSPLDDAAIVEAPSWLEAAQTESGAMAPALAATGYIPPEKAIELRSAMAMIDPDDRDNWITLGMALHSTGAPNAFGLWVEWSQLSPKYNPADQRRVWNSFSAKPNGVQIESVFAIATRAGWVNPRSAPAAKFQADTLAAIAAANAQTRMETVEVPEPAPVPDFPVPMLNDLAAWIDGRYPVTHPDVTRQAVLAIAALAASRVYVGEGGSPCHLCLGIVAESSVLSAYARDAIARALDESGLRRMLRGTRANAPSNVYSTLWRSPAAIHVVGDYGHLAQFAKRQPSGVLDQAFSVMADAYSASALYIDSPAEAGLKPTASDDQLVVHAPALTTLLLSTHEQMGGLLQRGELARGLLAYQLPVIATASGAVEREPTQDAMPQHLRNYLRTVRRLPSTAAELSMQEIFSAQPWQRPNLIRVRYALEFAEHLAAISAVSTEPEHRPLVLAAQGTARRLVNTLAAWGDPASPTATRAIMDWATAYVVRHLRAWLEQYSTLGNDDGRADVGQKVVAAIADRKTAGLPRSQLPNYCRTYRSIRDKDKRTRLIDSLIEDGDLVEFTPEGTRTKVLVAARFARRVELKVVA